MAIALTSLGGTVPTESPKVGDLLTVQLAFGKTCGARLERVSCDTYFVKLVGLQVPAPYKIGDRFPVNRDKVVDWG